LFLWGGAAAIASAGFAFMAANTVDASSAGEGTGTVSGYTVSGISYTPIDNVYYTGSYYAAAEGVTFTLTSAGTGSAATQPTNVDVYPLDLSGNREWGHDNGCSIVGSWTVTTTGTGTYHCDFAPEVPIAEIGQLAVEANQ
jgi:hypothetical protein